MTKEIVNLTNKIFYLSTTKYTHNILVFSTIS